MSSDRAEVEPGRKPAQRPGKSGGKRDRNRQERTRALCDAALTEFLVRAVERVTVDEITRAAGVAKGSFYRYFEDKEQVVEALFSVLARELDGALERCTVALATARTDDELNLAYNTLSVEMAGAILADPRLARLYLQESRGPKNAARRPIVEISERISSAALELTLAAQKSGMLRELPPHLTALAVVGAVEGLLLRYLEGDLGDPVAATVALTSMVLDGVRKR